MLLQGKYCITIISYLGKLSQKLSDHPLVTQRVKVPSLQLQLLYNMPLGFFTYIYLGEQIPLSQLYFCFEDD